MEIAVRVVTRAPVQDCRPLLSLRGHGKEVGEPLVKGSGVAHAIVVVVDVGGIVMLQAEQPEQPRRVPLQQSLFVCGLGGEGFRGAERLWALMRTGR